MKKLLIIFLFPLLSFSQSTIYGCTVEEACNYNIFANSDNGTCEFIASNDECSYCSGENDGSGYIINGDVNSNGICDLNEEIEILGCNDFSACNYNELSNLNDGSCIYPFAWYEDQDLDGLGDPSSFVYDCENPSTEIQSYVDNNFDLCPIDSANDADSDGVCESNEIFGCIYDNYCNYNPDATEMDGSCTNDNCGCTDNGALNYNSEALHNYPNNCIYGDISSLYFNYDLFFDSSVMSINSDYATVGGGFYELNQIQGEIIDFNGVSTDFEYVIFVTNFINYDDWYFAAIYTKNNNIISFFSLIEIRFEGNTIEFDNNCNTDFTLNISGNSYQQSYPSNSDIYDDDFTVSLIGDGIESGFFLDNGSSVFEMKRIYFGNETETYYDYQNGVEVPLISLCSDYGNNIYYNDLSISGVEGCTDESAFNFNIYATIQDEDEECCYISGCTDSNASNYNFFACHDDGSCVPFVSGCMDVNALNYNIDANLDNNSCCYTEGCTDLNSFNYNPNACFDDDSCISIIYGCTDNNAINYNATANTDDGSCLIWNYPLITSCDMTIGITSESLISLDDEELEEGDWIGAFYLDENGNEICGGALKWLGDNSVISLWADDEEYYDEGGNCIEGCGKNGFDNGEEIIWKLWDSTNLLEMTNILEFEFISNEPNIFSCNGVELVDYVFSYSTVTQDIELNDGWNIFSTYISPPNNNIQEITSNINIDIVKNCCGSVYWPQIGVNSIGDIQIDEGYWIKVNNESTLSITGDIIPSETEINLSEGWSIIPYLSTQPNEISVVMSPITEYIDIIKDDNGNVYWPFLDINNIINMSPGEGYQIKTSDAVSLSFTDGNGRLAFEEHKFISRKYPPPINTGNNMVVAILKDAWNKIPKDGDEIVVFDNEGLLVGNTPY